MSAITVHPRTIVVIGASSGGVEALLQLVALLPADFPAAVFVVIHVAADSPGVLPTILGRESTLPVAYAVDGDSILPGRIVIAPADQHLVLEKGRVRLTHGPKENRFRPAVDPLFRSAAYTYGPQVIGIVLTGALDDGTSGLWAIKDRGGLAIVQDPNEAAYPSMPLHALKYVRVDYRLTIPELAKLLPRLVAAGAPIPPLEPALDPALDPAPVNLSPPHHPDQLGVEAAIALEHSPLNAGVLDLGPLTPYTCPECSGVLVQLHDGNLLRFRCHTGHAYTRSSLLAAVNESIENTLWDTVRVLEEHLLLLQHLGRHAAAQGEADLARRFSTKAQTADDNVQIVRQLALLQTREDSTP
jgi:two-component system chemotaxis response regulator CheB